MKKKVCFILAMTLTLGTSAFAKANSIKFVDVDKSYWGYSSITEMADEGIVNGYEDNTFQPDKKITKAEFSKIFSLALKTESSNEKNVAVSDVDVNHWAYNYIESSIEYFPDTDDGSFKPNEYITREDAAYALAKKVAPNVNTNGVLDRFTDAGEISDDKKYNVSLAVASGIMNGYGNGELNPTGSLTRAQVCTMITNVKHSLVLNTTGTADNTDKTEENTKSDVNKTTEKEDKTQSEDKNTTSNIPNQTKDENKTPDVNETTKKEENKTQEKDKTQNGNKNNTSSVSSNNSESAILKKVSDNRIALLEDLDIMYRYTDGTFRPEEIPSGSMAVSYVVKLMGLEPAAKADTSKGKYKGLDSQHWANGYFYIASEYRFFNNLDEKKFASDEKNITCQEFVMLVLNAMGYGNIMKGSANNYWLTAMQKDLVNGMEFNSPYRTETISRGYVANVLYNALNAPIFKQIAEADGVVTSGETNETLCEIYYGFKAQDENKTTEKEENKTQDENKNNTSSVPSHRVEAESLKEVSDDRVDLLEDLDIMYRYTDGTFRPEEIPSGSMAVSYVVKLMGLEPAAKADTSKGKYKKLDSQHWANGYFYIASEYGLFKNLDEKKFASDDYDITCQEFVTLVLNAMGYGDIMMGNANNYWMKAKEKGLFDGMKFGTIDRTETICRGYVANVLYNALNASILEKNIEGNGTTYGETSKTLREIYHGA